MSFSILKQTWSSGFPSTCMSASSELCHFQFCIIHNNSCLIILTISLLDFLCSSFLISHICFDLSFSTSGYDSSFNLDWPRSNSLKFRVDVDLNWIGVIGDSLRKPLRWTMSSIRIIRVTIIAWQVHIWFHF